LPPFSLADHLAAIERCFTAETVPDIIAHLEQEIAANGADWAKAALKALRTVSPSALFWTLQALRNGAGMNLPQALDAEFRLTKTTMAHPDFAEGVRAMVVDKDRKPAWNPPRIEDVHPASIAALFAE
jgi:enoyl-CoA hydratase